MHQSKMFIVHEATIINPASNWDGSVISKASYDELRRGIQT
jgi:hypothetical protein